MQFSSEANASQSLALSKEHTWAQRISCFWAVRAVLKGRIDECQTLCLPREKYAMQEDFSRVERVDYFGFETLYLDRD